MTGPGRPIGAAAARAQEKGPGPEHPDHVTVTPTLDRPPEVWHCGIPIRTPTVTVTAGRRRAWASEPRRVEVTLAPVPVTQAGTVPVMVSVALAVTA